MELARLDDSITITVEGSAIEYNIEYNTTTNQHTITWAESVPTGVKYSYIWYDKNNVKYGSGAGDITESITIPKELEDGYTLDLRIFSSWTLNKQRLNIVITPASTKTYTVPTGE